VGSKLSSDRSSSAFDAQEEMGLIWELILKALETGTFWE